MYLIYIFATLGILLLIGVYVNALINCYFIWEWLSHTKAITDINNTDENRFYSLEVNDENTGLKH